MDIADYIDYINIKSKDDPEFLNILLLLLLKQMKNNDDDLKNLLAKLQKAYPYIIFP
jgi:hypothetical protein